MSNQENEYLREDPEAPIFSDNEKNEILNGKKISITIFEQSQLLLLYLLHFPIMIFILLSMIYNLPKDYHKIRIFFLIYSISVIFSALFRKCIIYLKYEKQSNQIIIKLNNLFSEIYPKIKFLTKTLNIDFNDLIYFIVEIEDCGKGMLNIRLYYSKNLIEICILNLLTFNQHYNECLKLKQYFDIINSLNDKKQIYSSKENI